MNPKSKDSVIQQTHDWLVNVVIGLNLCPFAAKPYKNKQIRITICESVDEKDIIESMIKELTRLDDTPIEELETTLFVTPHHFQSFSAYNQFLDVTDMLIEQFGYTGQYQIASFHPDYCFADTEPNDSSNLTNQSPYPTFHLIREASIDRAKRYFGGDIEAIPLMNIERVCALTPEERRELFPYLLSR